MALIKCPECEKEISSNAVSCPHCGEPMTAAPNQPQTVVNPQNAQTNNIPVILTTCKKCRGKFPRRDKKCPHCGAKVKAPLGLRIFLSVLIGFLVLIILIASLPNPSPSTDETSGDTLGSSGIAEASPAPSPSPTPEIIEVAAEKLLDDYDVNGVKADSVYKGKTLAVTGIVKNIDSDILDNPYVTLGTGASYEFVSVQCFFNKSDIDLIVELAPGDEITIIGTCEGSTLNVVLKKCTIE